MAKRRTKKDKRTAKARRVEDTSAGGTDLVKKAEKTAESEPSIADIAFTGEEIYLVKKDLLKTVILTVIISILLFGIYVYLR